MARPTISSGASQLHIGKLAFILAAYIMMSRPSLYQNPATLASLSLLYGQQ